MDCHFVNYREITARYTTALAARARALRCAERERKETVSETCNGYASNFYDAGECRVLSDKFHDPSRIRQNYSFARCRYLVSRTVSPFDALRALQQSDARTNISNLIF